MRISQPTTTARILSLAAIAVSALAFAGCAASAPAPADTTAATAAPTGDAAIVTDAACVGDEGVTLVVDAQAIDGGEPSTWCVPTEGEIIGADVLAAAGVETVGTTEYPDLIVCRVDGVPAADFELVSTDGTVVTESCESMPPAFAYWSLWVKPAGAEWGYATEGLATQPLAPGDSLELLFQLNGEPALPAS